MHIWFKYSVFWCEYLSIHAALVKRMMMCKTIELRMPSIILGE